MISELTALRRLIFQALSEPNPLNLKPALGAVLCRRYWDEFQLDAALRSLASHLIGINYHPPRPKQLPNGAALIEWAGHLPQAALPDLSAAAELATLWMVLGILREESDLCTASLKLANWQLHLLDSSGFPHLALWSQGGGFSVPNLLAYQHLLFTLSAQVCIPNVTGNLASVQNQISNHVRYKEPYFEKAAELQKNHLKGWKRDELCDKLYHLVAPKLPGTIRYRLNTFTEEVTVGMAKWADHEISVACTLSGYNSGMGSFHKKETAVVNFGPHAEQLDDLKQFGIDRPCSMRDQAFADLRWEKDRQGMLLKGWTKVFALPLSIFATMVFVDKKLDIKVEFEEGKSRKKLYFLFYLRGQKVVVGGRDHIQAYSLDRYQGVSLPITLYGESEKIYIEPGQSGGMSVIPLAGGDFFWGGDFLLAFEIGPEIGAVRWNVR